VKFVDIDPTLNGNVVTNLCVPVEVNSLDVATQMYILQIGNEVIYRLSSLVDSPDLATDVNRTQWVPVEFVEAATLDFKWQC